MEFTIQPLVEKIIQTLQENYVYPDKAQEMGNYLQDRLQGKQYDSITDVNALARQLTEDIQEISKDRHLNLHYNPQMFNHLQHSEEDEGEPNNNEWLQRGQYNNFGFEKVSWLTGNIGYIRLRNFYDAKHAGEIAIASMNFVANSDALIFDLRSNGGGSPTLIQLITSYLFDEPKHLNTFYWRPTDTYQQFWTQTHVQGKKLLDIPVYILTSKHTFSAAEEFTYNLKNMKRATIVGETTGGGAHPGEMKTLTDGFVMFVAMGRAINPITETNWEGTGIEPHIGVSSNEALATAHIHAVKHLFNNAQDETRKQRLTWELENLEAKYHPTEITADVLQQYIGEYDNGNRNITLEDNQLIYSSNGLTGQLLPISETIFGHFVDDGMRFEFVKDDNDITGVQIIFRDHQRKIFLPKTG